MRHIVHPSVYDVLLTDVLYALSDPIRLEIVRSLAASKDALTCTLLGRGRPKSSMSHHFRVLREAGIIRTHVAGKKYFNLLRRNELDQRFPGLLQSILEVETRV